MKVRILQFSTTFTQVYTRPKNNLLGSSLAFTLKEGPVRCAKVCNKSWVILTYYPPPIQSTFKKNVGVFASMLYVYYKFHMQCVNQQKIDKKEKNCCTTAITLRRRKNQSQKYIYIKQTNKSFMNSYLISKLVRIIDNL